MLVRKVMMLLDVGPKLINECVPAFFVGHIFSVRFRITQTDAKPSAIELARIAEVRRRKHPKGVMIRVCTNPLLGALEPQFEPQSKGYPLEVLEAEHGLEA